MEEVLVEDVEVVDADEVELVLVTAVELDAALEPVEVLDEIVVVVTVSTEPTLVAATPSD